MSRTDRLSQQVARLEKLEIEAEVVRRRALANGIKPTPPRADRVGVAPTAAAAAALSDRPSRVRAACAMYAAPAALAADMNRQGLTVRQAHDLLSKATGSARSISAAGVESVRVGLVALERARQTEAVDRDAGRHDRVARLLARFGLVQTRAGVAIAASSHPVDLLERLVSGRANAFGRLDAAAQAHLLHDLTMTKRPATP